MVQVPHARVQGMLLGCQHHTTEWMLSSEAQEGDVGTALLVGRDEEGGEEIMATFENIRILYYGDMPHAVMAIAIDHMTASGLCEVRYVGPQFIDFILWRFNTEYTAEMKAMLDEAAKQLEGSIEYWMPIHGLIFEREWEGKK